MSAARKATAQRADATSAEPSPSGSSAGERRKAAQAFRTIAEVSDDLGIAKHVLRFWELKFSQVRPMKRGGGRRFYRPDDVELLRGIRHLLQAEAFTIKGVQKILREQGVESVKQIGATAAATGTRGRRAARDLQPKAAETRPDSLADAAAPSASGGRLTADATVETAIRTAIAQLGEIRAMLAATSGAEAGVNPATVGRVHR